MSSLDSVAEKSSALSALAAEYAQTAITGDETACFEIYDRALATGATMVDVYQDFLSAGMGRIGDWYHTGRINEACEHLASEITERLMHRTAFHFGQGERIGLQALLGGGPESWHVIGLRMIADVLRHRGWQTMYLGPNVPTLSFVETVRVNRPNLVLLSCSAAEAVRGTTNLLHALKAYRDTVPDRHDFLIGVGGLLVPTHRAIFSDAGADFTSPDLRSFVDEAAVEIERVGASDRVWSSARLAAL